ncbi:4-nitrophenylphosphatase [Saccharomycopsis crataegensis]|uniref:4-nitrophenylphosphatase n=1 Tax=Saccharomycopsis crataegensis TaxID=43959 RepID=A0AAV5QUI3_9ASCO|nr:4-nitrophenylphosphatase [Saccharomycopsis crataegensis]
MSLPQKITTKEQVDALLDQYDNFLFDCDGVLWLGDHLLPHVVETLAFLKSKGKKLIFVTNNSTKSRENYLKKFEKFGVKGITKSDIFGSAYATAVYLDKVMKFDHTKKVWVLGGQGVHDELTELGIQSIGGTDPELDKPFSDDSKFLKLDPEVGAVIAGLDTSINYHRLSITLQYLLDPNVIFMATNIDSTFPSHGKILPGAGSIIESAIYSSGRQPTVCGKPNMNLLKAIQAEHNLNLERSIMVGDRLNTDMKFGKDGGLGTLLVLTGIETEANVLKQDGTPKYYADKLGDLYELQK